MMGDKLNLLESMGCSVERPRNFENFVDPFGKFVLQHIREGKVIAKIPFPNGVTDQGKTYMLDASFNGVTQSTIWSLGLIIGTTPILVSGDTMAIHSGWFEFITYNEATRQTWNKASTVGNVVAGTSSSVFTIGSVAANTFVAGGFVASNSTKGGTTGILWSTGLFTNPVPVQPTDIFKLGYLTGL